MVWFMMLYRDDRFYWWSTLRKPPTCRKFLTNLITLRCIEYTYPWTGFEYTTYSDWKRSTFKLTT